MHTKYLFRAFISASIIIPVGLISLKQKNTQLFSWGFGRNGQLGIGSQSNISLPQLIKIPNNFIDIDAKKSISAGITIDGKLYTWGKNRNGIIGHHPPNLNVLLPREVEIQGQKVVRVACGYEQMCVVTEKGEVYVWGLDVPQTKFRQRGTSQAKKQLSNSVRPIKIQNLKNIIQVSCSSQYITFLSSSGTVYLMGRSPIKSKTNQTNKSSTDIIQLNLSNIKKIQSGINHSLALSTDGKVFSFGNNTFGQLGTGSLRNQPIPILLDHFIKSKVTDISCGDNYSGAVTENGEVYTWGYGNQGQLGHGDKSDQMFPRKVNNLDTKNQKIVQISCGGGHTAMVTDKNKLLMMGRGREGQLGREQIDQSNSGYSLKIKQVEQLPKNKNIVKVVSGGNHTMVLLEDFV